MGARERREAYVFLVRVFESGGAVESLPLFDDETSAVLLDLARTHGLSALLKDRLASADLWTNLPASLQKEFESDARAIAQQTIRNEELIERLDGIFRANDIPYCILKGRPLELRCYGPAMLRPAEDVDVLIPPEERDHAVCALNEAGFHALPHHTENFFTSAIRGGKCDLHTDFVSTLRVPSRVFVHQLDRGLWRRRETVALNGRAIPVLSSEDTILHLAIHTLLHHGGTRLLNWIDLDRALNRLDWNSERIIAAARKQQCEKTLSAALIQVHRLLKTPLPDELIEQMTPPSRATKILLRAASETPDAPEEIRFPITLLMMPDSRSTIRFARETLFPSRQTLESLETTQKSRGAHLRFKHWKETLALAGQTLTLTTRALTKR